MPDWIIYVGIGVPWAVGIWGILRAVGRELGTWLTH